MKAETPAKETKPKKTAAKADPEAAPKPRTRRKAAANPGDPV